MQHSKAKFSCIDFQRKWGKSFKPVGVFQLDGLYRKMGQNVKKREVWKWDSLKRTVVGHWIPLPPWEANKGLLVPHSKSSKVGFKIIPQAISQCTSCSWEPRMPALHLGNRKSTLDWGLTPSQEILRTNKGYLFGQETKKTHPTEVFIPRVMRNKYLTVFMMGHNPTGGCLGPCPTRLSESWNLSGERLKVYCCRACRERTHQLAELSGIY